MKGDPFPLVRNRLCRYYFGLLHARVMVSEFLDGEELTGKHAAIIFSVWLGVVMLGAFVLTVV